MTEYEMAYLYTELTNSMILIATSFFSVLSAFLIVSYLAAHKLTRTMTAICVGLYMFLCAGAFSVNLRTISTLVGLAKKMKGMEEAGSGLEWHSAASLPDFAYTTMPVGGALLYGAATVASIVFFFHCRRVNRKAEAGSWKPKT